jgi:KAP family P-loop domain
MKPQQYTALYNDWDVNVETATFCSPPKDTVPPGQAVLFADTVTDGSISAAITVIEGQQNPAGDRDPIVKYEFHECILMFRYISEDQFYVAGIGGFAQAFYIAMSLPSQDQWRLLKATGSAHDLQKGKTYHLRVEFVGERMTLFSDDVAVISATDDSYPSGRCGLRTNRTQAKFEHVDIESHITPSVTSTSPAVQGGSYLPGYSADVVRAKGLTDWLDITRDVNALAALIAARDLVPPLSIGLFGEWGTGKTFFMRQLINRIDAIAQAARTSSHMQKDIQFYKGIVQIEFNAWHYVDGNLWASLVDHIFSNLRLSGTPEAEEEAAIVRLQNTLLDKIGAAKVAEQEANEKVQQAQSELERAQQAVVEAREHYDQESRKLQRLTVQNVWEVLLAEPQVQDALNQDRQQLNELRQKLGLPALEGEMENFQAAVVETQAAAERGLTLFTSLVRSPQQLQWLLAVLIGMPLLALILGWGASTLAKTQGQTWFAQATTLLTFLSGLLGGGAGWLRRQANWVSDQMALISATRRRIDARVEKAQGDLRKQVVASEKEIELLKEQYTAAQQAHTAAQQKVAQAQAELAETTRARRLARFIQERVQSNDYRQHLGILALIRRDFERLSNLIGRENESLQDVQDLDQEKRDADVRINRIVLYIDDLDRCPPAKVVEILQAVHLLLAFPLFVAVVAVDARWLSRSLQARYTDLLQSSVSPETSDRPTGHPESATPLDYLEKIFQIPFWVRPMDLDSRLRMLRGLLQPLPDHAVEARVPLQPPDPSDPPLSPPDSPTVGPLDPLPPRLQLRLHSLSPLTSTRIRSPLVTRSGNSSSNSPHCWAAHLAL